MFLTLPTDLFFRIPLQPIMKFLFKIFIETLKQNKKWVASRGEKDEKQINKSKPKINVIFDFFLEVSQKVELLLYIKRLSVNGQEISQCLVAESSFSPAVKKIAPGNAAYVNHFLHKSFLLLPKEMRTNESMCNPLQHNFGSCYVRSKATIELGDARLKIYP